MAQPNYGALSAPTDYQSELADIKRRQMLAQALQEQGMQPSGGTEMVGGWAIPKSPFEGLGKAAQQLSGAYQQNQLRKEEKQLNANETETQRASRERLIATLTGQTDMASNPNAPQLPQ